MNAWRLAVRLFVAALALLAGSCQAHLMVAQKGTLSFKGGSAYLVVSLPVSAFHGFDDDADGQLSLQELQRHGAALQQQFEAGARLLADGRQTPFELLLLNLSAPDDRPGGPATQLLVMGRYVLPSDSAAHAATGFRFALRFFGAAPAERSTEIAFAGGGRTQVLTFTPEAPEHALFSTGYRLAVQQLQSGTGHVLGGGDHLLFLLVVLAETLLARRGWRHGLLLLTAFTAGHGLTLAATVLGPVSLSPSLVEPAIAATIVAMAMYTLWQMRRGVAASPRWQLALVTACALVHGLGLGDALRSQGWSRHDLPWALAGFNAGVELAQVAVALAAAAMVAVARRVVGAHAGPSLARASSWLAFALGVWWVAERSLLPA